MSDSNTNSNTNSNADTNINIRDFIAEAVAKKAAADFEASIDSHPSDSSLSASDDVDELTEYDKYSDEYSPEYNGSDEFEPDRAFPMTTEQLAASMPASGDVEDLHDLQADTTVPMTAEDLAIVHRNIADFCSGKPVTLRTITELEQLIARLKERVTPDLPYDGFGTCEVYVYSPPLE